MTTQDYQRRSPLRIFLHYFGNHKKLFALDILCAVGIAGIDLAFPLVTRSALYDLLPNRMFRTFFFIMAAVMVSYVLRSFLNFIVAYYGHTFGIRVEADIRKDLFSHMQDLSFDFYDQNRTGKLMARLTSDLFELTELAHHGPEDLLTSILTICGALAVMISIRWELAVMVALMIPIFLVVVMTLRTRMGRASAAAKEKTGHINQEIESSLSGIRTAKAFGNSDVERARFNAANEIYKTSKREFHKAMGLFNSSVEFFLCSLNVVVIGFGGYYVMKGEMDYRDLITFLLRDVRQRLRRSEAFRGSHGHGAHHSGRPRRPEPGQSPGRDCRGQSLLRLRRRSGCASRRVSDSGPGRNRGHCRALRRRKIHAVPADSPVL